jgi:hypothetical protein
MSAKLDDSAKTCRKYSNPNAIGCRATLGNSSHRLDIQETASAVPQP